MKLVVAKSKFPLGEIVMSPRVEALGWASLQRALQRHAAGDWGDLNEGDKESNDNGLKIGERLFSAYKAADGTAFWIITEADRSATYFLLPEEYS